MEFIKKELKQNALWVTLNRPKKYNAITRTMFIELSNIFNEAAEDDEVSFIVFTGGSTKFYSAGADFSPAELSNSIGNQTQGYKVFVDTLIGFPKPVIALVNGPAIGVAVTTLALMDIVIAIDTATFTCPFSEIGLCPEAAASKTFVETMGYQKAAALLLFSDRFTAHEAYIAGLVTKVIPAKDFVAETSKLIAKYATLSPATYKVGKKLMRTKQIQDSLLAVNRNEEKKLVRMFTLDDTINRLSAKFSPSSKL